MEHRKATRSFTNHIAYVFISLIIFVIIALTSVSYMITSTNITDGFINQKLYKTVHQHVSQYGSIPLHYPLDAQ